MRLGNEVRVGVVVVMALILMAGGYIFLRGIGFGADIYTIRLNGAATIAAGNDVRLQGIKVGTVQSVTLDPATQRPLISVAIRHAKPPYRLLQSYRYTVQSSALIGENFVDIRGDFNPEAPTYLANADKQIIPGTATPGISALTDSAGVLTEDLGKTLKKVNITLERVNKGILSYENQQRLARTFENVTKLSDAATKTFGPTNQNQLNRILSNTAQASQEGVAAVRQASIAARNLNGLTRQSGGLLTQADGFLRQANGIAKENRGQLRELLTSFNGTAKNLSGLTESLRFVVDNGGFKENTQIALGALRRSAENFEATTAGFRRLGEDPVNQDALKTTIASIRDASSSLASTAASINTLVGNTDNQAQLKSTFNTLSQTATTLQATTNNLLTITEGLKTVAGDPQVQSDLKAIPASLRGTLEATQATAERINALLGGKRPKKNPTGDTKGDTTKVLERSSLYSPGGFDFTARHLSKDVVENGRNRGRNFGDINFNTELFGAPFRAGLANIGEGTDVTLQTGRFLGKNGTLRYGLYRSKLGVGADYQLGRFALEGNLYDPNDRDYTLYGSIRLNRQLDLLIGRENQNGVGANSIGVRLRR